MSRIQKLLVVAILMSSAPAFAADTKGSPPAPTVTENFNQLPAPGEKIPSPGEVNKGKGGDKDAVATTPVEESKGKPKVAE
jgi:hypothetical protein